jgi:2,4-didehydro-3-deoxy-L-rhamnonate hydrolase
VRLVRLGEPGRERPFVLLPDGADPDRVVDVGDLVADFDTDFFAADGLQTLRSEVPRRTALAEPVGDRRIGPPLARPGAIVCIGLNYVSHAEESAMAVPTEPVVFLKSSHAWCGPRDDVFIPRGSAKTDWEVELGVVVGTRCRYLESAAEGLAAVAGYMVCHDVSEREFQLDRGGQWDKGKSCERFNPAGPWLVTADEVGDPGRLRLWLDVNGERRQSGCTADMLFDVGEIVRYLSQFMVLEPGDVINTGTPPGVALGRPDQPYLRPGDVVTLGISGLGEQRQRFVAAA